MTLPLGRNVSVTDEAERSSVLVSHNASSPLTQRVQVRLGESLLLKLEKKGDNGLALGRVLHGRVTDPGTLPPPAPVKNWLLGTWQDRRTDRESTARGGGGRGCGWRGF